MTTYFLPLDSGRRLLPPQRSFMDNRGTVDNTPSSGIDSFAVRNGLLRSYSTSSSRDIPPVPRVSMTPPSSLGRRRRMLPEEAGIVSAGSGGELVNKKTTSGFLAVQTTPQFTSDGGRSPDLPVVHFRNANIGGVNARVNVAGLGDSCGVWGMKAGVSSRTVVDGLSRQHSAEDAAKKDMPAAGSRQLAHSDSDVCRSTANAAAMTSSRTSNNANQLPCIAEADVLNRDEIYSAVINKEDLDAIMRDLLAGESVIVGGSSQQLLQQQINHSIEHREIPVTKNVGRNQSCTAEDPVRCIETSPLQKGGSALNRMRVKLMEDNGESKVSPPPLPPPPSASFASKPSRVSDLRPSRMPAVLDGHQRVSAFRPVTKNAASQLKQPLQLHLPKYIIDRDLMRNDAAPSRLDPVSSSFRVRRSIGVNSLNRLCRSLDNLASDVDDCTPRSGSSSRPGSPAAATSATSSKFINSHQRRTTGADDVSLSSFDGAASEMSRSDPALSCYESAYGVSCGFESEYDNYRPGMASDEDYFIPDPISDIDIDLFDDVCTSSDVENVTVSEIYPTAAWSLASSR